MKGVYFSNHPYYDAVVSPNEIHVDGLKKTSHIPHDVLDTLNFMGVRYRFPEKDQRYIIIQKKDCIGKDKSHKTIYKIREYLYYLKSGKAKCAETKEDLESSNLEEFLEKYIK